MSEAIDYNTLLTNEEFESRLRKIGETRYHNLHPFHKLLHGGKLNKGQVQAWALNRYYYHRLLGWIFQCCPSFNVTLIYIRFFCCWIISTCYQGKYFRSYQPGLCKNSQI